MRSATTTLVVIVSLSLASGGCAAGGLAAVGPLVSAFQIIGDRSVERTVPTGASSAAAATVDALQRMGIPVKTTSRSDEGWEARAEGGTVTVHARLTKVTDRLTKIALRVESGRLTADKGTAEEIQNQIAQALAHRAEAVREPASRAEAETAAVTNLEAEVRRLRFEMERERSAARRSVPDPDRAAQPRIRDGAVLSIPGSYGLPTPARASALVDPVITKPASAGSAGAPSPRAVEKRPDVASPRPYTPVVEPGGILARPLEPVSVLAPIQPMTGLGNQD